MNRYLWCFYKIDIPAFFIFLTPISTYFLFPKAPSLEIYSTIGRVLYPRLNCDVAVILSFGGVYPEFYALSYFLGLAMALFFLLTHIVNICISGRNILNFFKFKRAPHFPPSVVFLSLLSASLFFFFTLSTWKTSSAIGCSWFSKSNDAHQFQQQFWKTLLFIGFAWFAIYSAIVGSTVSLLRILNRNR